MAGSLRLPYRGSLRSLEPREFLSLVWPQPLTEGETLELRVLRPGGGILQRSFHATVEEFLIAARQFSHANVYFGVATRREKDGTKGGCLRAGAFWIDLDGRELSLEKLEDLKPQIIVDSGNGYHLYWLLAEPLEVQGHLEEIEAVNRGLADRLGGDPAAVDVTRILRVPGFHNHKTTPPKPVTAYLVGEAEQ